MDHASAQPVIVFPLHDPEGGLFPHISAVRSLLTAIFGRAFVSVTPETAVACLPQVAALACDPFFDLLMLEAKLPVGLQFRRLYAHAAEQCHADQLVHLCFIDRAAFALQSHHRASFVHDMRAVRPEDTPLLFQRSPAAWATHPRNYFELEQSVTAAGERLLGKSLDFAWCHLAVRASCLRELLPRVVRHDLSMMAELALLLRDEVNTRDVDWLAWEDPFILGQDDTQLRSEREQSQAETRKRLAYVAPMLEAIVSASRSEVR